jgi:hypothetical protein
MTLGVNPNDQSVRMPLGFSAPQSDYGEYQKHNWLIYEAYSTPFAQAQRLRDAQTILPDFPTQAILSPDAQSQTETGYTQPIQDFTGGPTVAGTYFTQPGGITNGSSNSQPNLKMAQPQTPIPTGMPWNY